MKFSKSYAKTSTMINDFIQNVIDDLFKVFPILNECVYSYDKYSDTHFIKIESLDVYESEEFAKFDAESSLKFYSLGLSGSLCFLSSNSLIDLIEPETYINSGILNEVILDDINLNFNLVDLSFTIHDLIENTIKPEKFADPFFSDNSFTYSLAA